MAETDQVEERLAKAIAEEESAEGVAGAFLLGFVVMAEWMDAEGVRWLSRRAGTGQGESIPSWMIRGYLNEGLNHWPEPELDDEDSE